MNLKNLRRKINMTQVQAAEYLQVSLRTYKTYENDSTRIDTIKYRYMVQELEKLALVDETHGILAYDEIVRVCESIFTEYPITFCYLFGSYAKGKATEISDVDLLVSSEVKGLQFYGLVEKLREKLHKKVDVLSSEQLKNNEELIYEVLKDGIKIYG